MRMDRSIDRLIEEANRVRERINVPVLHHDFFADQVHWPQFVAALDTIGDTALAVRSYRRLRPTRDPGLKYLRLYGLFQALFLQQDAVFFLCKVAGGPVEVVQHADPGKWATGLPALRTARGLRNDATGHPVLRTKGRTSHLISRPMLGSRGLLLIRFAADQKPVFVSVHIAEIIRRQCEALAGVLVAVLAHLAERERNLSTGPLSK